MPNFMKTCSFLYAYFSIRMNNRLKKVYGKNTFITIELWCSYRHKYLLDFSLTVKSATLIFIYGCGSAISYSKEGNSGSIYNLVKS